MNTSATVPAALDGRLPDGDPVVVHFSGALPGGVWLVEVRQPARRHAPRRGSLDRAGRRRAARARARVDLLTPLRRLDAASGWRPLDARRRREPARLPAPRTVARSATATFRASGRSRPTRPSSPASPGSVEMPSASRPFTTELVTDLVGRGVADRAARCCTPACRRSRAASARTPSATASPRATAATINAVRHEWRSRDRRRHHRRPRARHRHRRPRRRAPRARAGPRSMVTPDTPVRVGRRPAHRLARARVVAPDDARGVRRTTPRSSGAYRAALDARVPLARVRRQPPHPARTGARDDAPTRPGRRRPRCPRAGGRCSTPCAGAARRPPSRSPSSSA